MGYDLHITRADDWFDSEQHSITAEEWLALIETDPELELAGDNGPYFTLWKGTSAYDEAWFDWDQGRIYTKNPDPPIIEKMISIAEKFGASVMGDDGERYPGPENDRYRQESAQSSPPSAPEEEVKPSIWKRLFGR